MMIGMVLNGLRTESYGVPVLGVDIWESITRGTLLPEDEIPKERSAPRSLIATRRSIGALWLDYVSVLSCT
jgi:hypothetical protein